MSNIIDPPILDSTGQRIAIALEAVNFGHDTSYFSQSSSVQNTEEGATADILSESTGKRIAVALENIFTDPSGLMHLLNMDSDSDEDIYGFEESYGTRDPSERITYIGKNADWDPITINDGGGYNLHQWQNFKWLQKNKPYMVKKDGTIDYALDPNDYTKKLDGTPSDVSNPNYDGAGAFSWGEKIYRKSEDIYDEDDHILGRRIKFSFVQHDGFEPVGFVSKQHVVLDGRWIPMFYGSVIDGIAKTIGDVDALHGMSYNDHIMFDYILRVAGIKDNSIYNSTTTENPKANILGGPFLNVLIDLMILFAKTTDLMSVYGFGGISSMLYPSRIPKQPVLGGGSFYKKNNVSGGSEIGNIDCYGKIFHSIPLGSFMFTMLDPYIIQRGKMVYTTETYELDITGETYVNSNIQYDVLAYDVSDGEGAGFGQKYYKEIPGFGPLPVRPFFKNYSTEYIYGAADMYFAAISSESRAMPIRFGSPYRYHSGYPKNGPRFLEFEPNITNSLDLGYGGSFAVLMDPPAPAW